MIRTVKTTINTQFATSNIKSEFYRLAKEIRLTGYCGGIGCYISEPHFESLIMHPSLGDRVPTDMAISVFGITLKPDFNNTETKATEYPLDLPCWIFKGEDRTYFILEIE